MFLAGTFNFFREDLHGISHSETWEALPATNCHEPGGAQVVAVTKFRHGENLDD
jgi:hypothetical protein